MLLQLCDRLGLLTRSFHLCVGKRLGLLGLHGAALVVQCLCQFDLGRFEGFALLQGGFLKLCLLLRGSGR